MIRTLGVAGLLLATAATLASDAAEVQELLRGHPARVFFNQERRSLQVVGCRGETTVNVPLSTVFAASLAQAQAQ